MKIAAVHSNSHSAAASYGLLQKELSLAPIGEADVLVVLGGDGMLLHCFHESLHLNRPLYGMNRGAVGFLLNRFELAGLGQRIRNSQEAKLHPLEMTATRTNGEVIRALAFNEVL